MNLFSRVGIVLWGDVNAAWTEALGIGERTIRRFRSGDMEPPPGVWREMLIQVQGMRERTCAHAHSSEWAELEDQIKAELRKAQRPTAAPYIKSLSGIFRHRLTREGSDRRSVSLGAG